MPCSNQLSYIAEVTNSRDFIYTCQPYYRLPVWHETIWRDLFDPGHVCCSGHAGFARRHCAVSVWHHVFDDFFGLGFNDRRRVVFIASERHHATARQSHFNVGRNDGQQHQMGNVGCLLIIVV